MQVCLEDDDPNDSGIESSNGNGHTTLEREGRGVLEREGRGVMEREGRRVVERGASTGSDVFELEQDRELGGGGAEQDTSSSFQQSSSCLAQQSTTFRHGMRQRQISTSLVSHPVVDDNLLDFHGHKVEDTVDALAVQYRMYSMVCHRYTEPFTA